MLTLIALIAALQAQSPDQRAHAAADAAEVASAAAARAEMCGAAEQVVLALQDQAVRVSDSRGDAEWAVRQLELLWAEADGEAANRLEQLIDRMSRVGRRLEGAEVLNRDARRALYELQPPCIYLP